MNVKVGMGRAIGSVFEVSLPPRERERRLMHNTHHPAEGYKHPPSLLNLSLPPPQLQVSPAESLPAVNFFKPSPHLTRKIS